MRDALFSSLCNSPGQFEPASVELIDQICPDFKNGELDELDLLDDTLYDPPDFGTNGSSPGRRSHRSPQAETLKNSRRTNGSVVTTACDIVIG